MYQLSRGCQYSGDGLDWDLSLVTDLKAQHSEKLGIKIVLKKVSFILKRTETRKRKTEWAE